MTSPALSCTALPALCQIYLHTSPPRAPGSQRNEVCLLPTTKPQPAISGSAATHAYVLACHLPLSPTPPSKDTEPISAFVAI